MTLGSKVVATGAVALALGGAGAALAGGGHAWPGGPARLGAGSPGAFRAGHGLVAARGLGLQAAADYLGVDVATLLGDLRSGKSLAQIADATKGKSADGLISALVADANAKLAAAVKDGKLTQARSDAISGKLQQWITALVRRTLPALPVRPLGPHHLAVPLWGGNLKVASDYLGIPLATLLADLRSGKTLAQEAQAKNKSVDGLVQALIADAKAKLAAAVKAGKLTQAQADMFLENLTKRVTDRVAGGRAPLPGFPRANGGWHRGFQPHQSTGGVNA
jgi:hypothetical protein